MFQNPPSKAASPVNGLEADFRRFHYLMIVKQRTQAGSGGGIGRLVVSATVVIPHHQRDRQMASQVIEKDEADSIRKSEFVSQ